MSKKSFILGAALGSIIGLLLAPKSGKKTRADLRKKTQPLIKKMFAEMEKVKGLDRKKYEQMVEKFVGQQLKRAKVAKSTVEGIVDDLKGQWVEVSKMTAKKKTARKKKK